MSSVDMKTQRANLRENKRQVLRNCVSPELGLYALRESQRTKLGGEK